MTPNAARRGRPKGEPKERLQSRVPVRGLEELERLLAHARAAGRTDTTSVDSWVASWVVDAARVAAAGRPFGVAMPSDDRFRTASDELRDALDLSDSMEAVRVVVIRTARALAEDRDLLGLRPATPDPKPGRSAKPMKRR